MIVMNTAAKDVPEVLDGCQIWGTGRQVHLSNLMLLKEASQHPSAMGSGVVILENRTRSHCLQCGEDNALYDLVPVPDASQIALYEMQRGPSMQMDPSPHHH